VPGSYMLVKFRMARSLVGKCRYGEYRGINLR